MIEERSLAGCMWGACVHYTGCLSLKVSSTKAVHVPLPSGGYSPFSRFVLERYPSKGYAGNSVTSGTHLGFMVRPTVGDGRFMMGEHRVPPASLAEKRRLNALASRGGGDRSAIAKVAKKQKGASLAAAYAHRYADTIADHELSALLQQNSFEDHEELVTVGTRVGVPSSHPNKYGYASTAVVVNVSGRQ